MKRWNAAILYAIGLCCISLSVFADVNDSAVTVPWGYKGNLGPEMWGQLDPQFLICVKGNRQSPINIKNTTPASNNKLSINYHAAPLVLINDGYTKLMVGKSEILMNEGRGIQANFSAQSKESIAFNNQKYNLLQLHFHTPSENQYHGQAYPVEIHFVHQGLDGRVLMLAVFVTGGAANAEIEKILNHLPKDKGVEQAIKDIQFDPKALLPLKQTYFSFEGSLSSPPCTEGIHWIVMAHAITASPAQIMRIRQVTRGSNARLTQPLNGRQITSQ